MIINRKIILLILNDRHKLLKGFIESFKFANSIPLYIIYFNLLFVLIFRLVLVLFFDNFLKAPALAEL